MVPITPRFKSFPMGCNFFSKPTSTRLLGVFFFSSFHLSHLLPAVDACRVPGHKLRQHLGRGARCRGNRNRPARGWEPRCHPAWPRDPGCARLRVLVEGGSGGKGLPTHPRSLRSCPGGGWGSGAVPYPGSPSWSTDDPPGPGTFPRGTRGQHLAWHWDAAGPLTLAASRLCLRATTCWRTRTPLPRRKTVKGPGPLLSPRFLFSVTSGQLSEWQMLCCPQLPCLPAAVGESPGCLRGLGKHPSQRGHPRVG